MAQTTLLQINQLKKHFASSRFGKGVVLKAVDGVDLTINKGETLGLVGESGCGKSTLGRLLLRLLPATSGEVLYEGEDILKLNRKQMKPMRHKVQMIFQNPYASLNPRMRIIDAVKAPLDVYHEGSAQEKLKRVKEVFDLVSLEEEYLYRYPHEFSGGQRQRIAIARALMLDPSFIICDEPVSALDVSVRAQVLNLMRDIQQNLGLSYLFISHDLSVVYHISDSIAVMYLGKIVEKTSKAALFENPLHPYTKALLSAVLQPYKSDKPQRRIILKGEVPSPLNVPSGCCFRTRCEFATEKCASEVPELKDIGNDHFIACHYRTPKDSDYPRLHPDANFYI